MWVPVTTAWRVLRLRMEERPPIWRVVVNKMKKQPRTADEVWSSSISLLPTTKNFVQHPALKVNSICRGNYWGSSM